MDSSHFLALSSDFGAAFKLCVRTDSWKLQVECTLFTALVPKSRINEQFKYIIRKCVSTYLRARAHTHTHTHTRVLIDSYINPLNAKVNPICHLLALLGAHHILHVSRIRVNTHARAYVPKYIHRIIYLFKPQFALVHECVSMEALSLSKHSWSAFTFTAERVSSLILFLIPLWY
jgi:hypothetical protein